MLLLAYTLLCVCLGIARPQTDLPRQCGSSFFRNYSEMLLLERKLKISQRHGDRWCCCICFFFFLSFHIHTRLHIRHSDGVVRLPHLTVALFSFAELGKQQQQSTTDKKKLCIWWSSLGRWTVRAPLRPFIILTDSYACEQPAAYSPFTVKSAEYATAANIHIVAQFIFSIIFFFCSVLFCSCSF